MRYPMRRCVLLSSLPLLLALVCPAWSATYYTADVGGNDGNPGGSTTPFKTIQKGISVLTPGDTLLIRGGTYNERIHPADYHLPSGSSWSAPITIAGAPGETAVIGVSGNKIQDNVDNSVVQYLIVDHLTFNAGLGGDILFEVGGNSQHIRLSNSDLGNGSPGIWIVNTTNDVQIVHNYIHDMPAVFAPEYGETLGSYGSYTNGSNVVFDGNTFQNVSGYCIHNYWSGHVVDGTIIKNNTFINCGYDDGQRDNGTNVVIMAGSHNQFYNNVLYNNTPVRGSSIISISGGSGAGDGNLLYNNTFYNNVGAAMEVNTNTTATEIRNTICYLNTACIQNNGTPLLFQSNNLTTDPSFVNASGGDFHLTAGSAAINTGVTLASVSTDKDGIARPQGSAYDIGAYEYGGSGGGVTPGPQGVRWKLDEGTGTTTADATGNGYTGTLVASPPWQTGRVGAKSLAFNGTSQYVKNDAFAWAPNQPVTVVFWINKAAGTLGGAFGVRTTDDTQFGAHVGYTDGKLYWDYGDFSPTGRLSTDFSSYFGRWVHVALVSAGSSGAFKAIYLNGVQVASAISSGSPAVVMTGLDIGRRAFKDNTAYDAMSMDDFRLDNRVWSSAEILADYQQGARVGRHRGMTLR